MRKKFLLLLLILIPYSLFPDILVFKGKQRINVSTVTNENWIYLSLYDLKDVLGMTQTIEKNKNRFILHFPDKTLTFVPQNPFFLEDSKTNRMFLPFISILGKPFISTTDASDILMLVTSKDVFLLTSLNSIVIGKETFNPDSIVLHEKDDRISLIIRSTNELLTSIDDDRKGKLQVTLFNAVCKPSLSPPTDTKGEIKRIILKQEIDKAILSIYYDANKISKIEKELAEPSPSIKLTFYKKKEQPENVIKPVKPKKPIKKRRMNMIVLDPGHGGRDSGAVGPKGLTEKETVLKIAKEVREILREKVFKVLMTREDDSFVRLRQRSKLANSSGANLFVSIHCNATAARKEAGGFETYFLSTAKTSWARAVEAKENSVIKFETPSEQKSIVEYILWDMAQNEYLRESSDLAEDIQESLTRCVSIENRGVKQANFYVMREIYMPSVLVETSFISNKEEEKLLKNSNFRKKIAEGIAEGILKFKETYEKKLNQ